MQKPDFTRPKHKIGTRKHEESEIAHMARFSCGRSICEARVGCVKDIEGHY